jgi:hypothetical protein
MNRLEVKVDGNTTGFKHAMDSVRTQAKATAEHVTGSWKEGIIGGIVGAFSFETVRGAIENFIAGTKEIKDMSEQLEMSTDATQKWAKAADQVGASLGNVYSTLSAIQSKRQEAMRDPKAADLFSGIGMSREDVRHEDASNFIKDVLTKGGESDEKRKLLEQIIGRRGLKLIPAASRYDEAKPDYDSDAIKAADEAEKSEKRLLSSIGRIIGGIASFFYRATDDSVRRANQDTAKIISGDKRGGLLWRFLHRNDPNKVMENQTQEVINSRFPKILPPAETKTKPETDSDDPLIDVKNQIAAERSLRQGEAVRGLHEAERSNMSIADRKASIKNDLNGLQSEIKARQDALNVGLIYGMTGKQQAGMLQSDIEKQLSDDFIALTGLKARASGLTHELRDSKGFSFDADSMARVGLYSSSTISLNPMLELSRRQIDLLREIERNTGKHYDPHRR